ncbi:MULTISPECIES: response regulator transcription factor [Serratia]|uniref:Response regulator transcription factor n=1 Tax=Serratia fonticola TaxID=47917 RepID=A0AAP2B747_SERFO|nr:MULTISPECIES: response regulator transcription factor [Serratia]MBC3212498.1 response regulator transcription factor [Serratia fonticola]MBP1000132.1 response regulator transcription factor [Serratia fonticola]MBP1005096.1 response regulator transcription factor [Serratia fonticola]MBP1014782.1 response regulator transcription factor [Serratia fonticola]MBP1036329.1 response regulator transcription factor [Serratia fonticola]
MQQANHQQAEHATAESRKRILVVEPSRINWIGLQRLLGDAGSTELSFCRVSKLTDAKKKVYEFKPDVILFSSLSRGTDYLSLLSFLSDIASYHHKTNSVIWLQHDMAWMVQLLHAFGVDTVLIDPVNLYQITQCLGRDRTDKAPKNAALLGKQERLIALALLRGRSATAIANVTGKDVRTISTQKKSIIRKLQMTTNEELYLLAGKLVYLTKINGLSGETR